MQVLLLLSTIICITRPIVSFPSTQNKLHILSNEFINSINEKKSTWTAGRNFDVNTPIELILAMIHPDPLQYPEVDRKSYDVRNVGLPTEFDAREQWPNCDSIKEISDQGACDKDWAIAAATAMTDRICVAALILNRLSAEDIVSCCTSCQSTFPFSAWKYWNESGIVSGGAFDTTDGCIAYKSEPCEHYVEGSRKSCNETSCVAFECNRQCDEDSPFTYDGDKMYAKDFYALSNNVGTIQFDLYQRGPLEVTFTVYSDFLHYKTGVYQHVTGDKLGILSVKLLGWGVENNTPYWLIANSWNTDWGDNGFFKILRGNSECGIEDMVVGGTPAV